MSDTVAAPVSGRLFALPERFSRRFFWGYVMAGVSLAALACTAPAQTFAISLFRPHLESSLGLSGMKLSNAYCLGTLFAAFPQQYVGRLFDRYGARRTMLAVVLLLAATCAATSLATGLITIFLAFFLLRLLGQGALGQLAGSTVGIWFNRRLGRISGFMGFGMACVVATAPTAIEGLIRQLGWRGAYLALGGIVLAIMLPLLLLLTRDRPEDLRQCPDGQAPELDAATGQPICERALTLVAALKTGAYWVMAGAAVIMGFEMTAMFFHLKPILAEKGFEPGLAATCFLIFGIAQAAFTLGGGILADIASLRLMLATAMLTLCAGFGSLYQTDSTTLLYIAIGLLGLSMGLFAAVGGTLWLRYYGRPHLGSIRGSMHTAIVAASAGAAPVAQLGPDYLGGYSTMLLLMALAPLPLVVLAFFARQPAWEQTSNVPSRSEAVESA
jgi:MFS family permease